jgi:hypothetical protein
LTSARKPAFVVPEGEVGLSAQQKMTFDMYDAVADVLTTSVKGLRRLPAKLVERVVRVVLVHAIKQALHLGVYKFPGQLGYFRLERKRPTFTKGPDGQTIKHPPSIRLHFVEGNVVLSALGRTPRAIPSSTTIMNYTHAFPAEQASALADLTAQDLALLARDVAALLPEEGDPA